MQRQNENSRHSEHFNKDSVHTEIILNSDDYESYYNQHLKNNLMIDGYIGVVAFYNKKRITPPMVRHFYDAITYTNTLNEAANELKIPEEIAKQLLGLFRLQYPNIF